ncbi:hypothetical protein PLICRDRAFT_591791 [Plicaturopsis crispa FD-325 SS-3]|nr:hypothetical protein PLICRDRAFT_591791 [Plicaturopsis crispa FD-325 SS-3]
MPPSSTTLTRIKTLCPLYGTPLLQHHAHYALCFSRRAPSCVQNSPPSPAIIFSGPEHSHRTHLHCIICLTISLLLSRRVARCVLHLHPICLYICPHLTDDVSPYIHTSISPHHVSLSSNVLPWLSPFR